MRNFTTILAVLLLVAASAKADVCFPGPCDTCADAAFYGNSASETSSSPTADAFNLVTYSNVKIIELWNNGDWTKTTGNQVEFCYTPANGQDAVVDLSCIMSQRQTNAGQWKTSVGIEVGAEGVDVADELGVPNLQQQSSAAAATDTHYHHSATMANLDCWAPLFDPFNTTDVITAGFVCKMREIGCSN